MEFINKRTHQLKDGHYIRYIKGENKTPSPYKNVLIFSIKDDELIGISMYFFPIIVDGLSGTTKTLYVENYIENGSFTMNIKKPSIYKGNQTVYKLSDEELLLVLAGNL